MKRLLLLAFLLVPFALAHGDGAGRSSVWEVTPVGEGAGGAKLYLAGSIHLLRDDDLPLPAAFDLAYADSDELLMEVTSGDIAAAQAESMRLGMYGGGGKISDDLSPAGYQELRAFLRGAGLSRNAMDSFRPWMASMAISMAEMMQLGCRAELGVDSVFEVRAARDGKPVGSLETVAYQLGLFAGLEAAAAEAMLGATLRDMAEIETGFPRMVEAWRTGDAAGLDEIMNDSLRGQPVLRAVLMDGRNAKWMKTLEKKLAGEKTVMVVAGAGHMVGEGGLVALLEGRGYRVRQLGAGQLPKKERFVEL